MTICARPNAVSLAASHFEGPGLTKCIAGERAEFIIQVKREPDPLTYPVVFLRRCAQKEAAGRLRTAA